MSQIPNSNINMEENKSTENVLNSINTDLMNYVDSTITNFDRLKLIKKTKERQVYCHIAGLDAITSPIMAADDLDLMTSIVSPEQYYVKLTKLLYKSVKFPSIPTTVNYLQFIDNISNADRKILMWGVYTSTYNTIWDSIELTCPNQDCKNVFTDKITSSQIFNKEDIINWDKDVNFKEYIYPIEIILDLEDPDNPNNKLYSVIFNTCMPSISQYLEIFRLVTAEKLKQNFEQSGSMLSNSETLTMVSSSIKVKKSKDDINPDVISDLISKHSAITNFIPLDLASDVLQKYETEFDKYNPIFRKKYICEKCSRNFHYTVDVESALFNKFFR